jgi:hypothetical protein
VSGPVATIVRPSGRVDPLAHEFDIGMPRDRLRDASAKPSRSTASADPAGTLMRMSQARITEPSSRISAWSSPTALCSASSERKLFEQTSSASESV